MISELFFRNILLLLICTVMFSAYLYHYFMNNKNWHKLSHAHLLLRDSLTSVQRLRVGGVALQRIVFEVRLVFLANASIYFEMITDWGVVVSTWNKSFLRPYVRKSHWNITIYYVYSIWFGWYRIWFVWAVLCPLFRIRSSIYFNQTPSCHDPLLNWSITWQFSVDSDLILTLPECRYYRWNQNGGSMVYGGGVGIKALSPPPIMNLQTQFKTVGKPNIKFTHLWFKKYFLNFTNPVKVSVLIYDSSFF